MEEINVNVTDIDGKEYIELDTVEVKGSKYVYPVSYTHLTLPTILRV